jgi:SpoVK/Ycf46/Vps4 family AAA+-type ATPase
MVMRLPWPRHESERLHQLFFDEADALFGKRTAAQDSHDRYAGAAVNYLMQRIEDYRGFTILTTNTMSVLEPAFLRRLRFVVTFPFPGVLERKLMWQRVFPKRVETEMLDYEFLARFHLTGGSIHNIALNAAYLAAQRGTCVTMPLLETVIRGELGKLELL